MGKVIVHGGGDRVVVRDTSESQSEPDETNAAIREEYRKRDQKKLDQKKFVFLILLSTAVLIATIGATLYFTLN